jgi:transcriptional regulator with XRE-family HTH domain
MRISAKNQVSVKTRSRASKGRSPVPIFPNAIAVLRRAKGVSQRALAERVEVKPRQLRRIEAGEVDLTGSRLLLIADFLDVSLDPLCRRKRRDA